MSDKLKITVGMAVLFVVAAFPIWHALASSANGDRPELELPNGPEACVREKAYMTANHMDLLNQWRNAVVRDGEHTDVSHTGVEHVMSLTGTCLGCHANRETFCQRCHDYAGVEPACWDCHVEPEGN